MFNLFMFFVFIFDGLIIGALTCYWQVLLEKFRQIILPKFFLFIS